MIAVITSKAEADKFHEILGEEAERLFDILGELDFGQPGIYEALMSSAKVRFRAWQMEQPGFDKSVTAQEYRREAIRDYHRKAMIDTLRQTNYGRKQ